MMPQWGAGGSGMDALAQNTMITPHDYGVYEFEQRRMLGQVGEYNQQPGCNQSMQTAMGGSWEQPPTQFLAQQQQHAMMGGVDWTAQAHANLVPAYQGGHGSPACYMSGKSSRGVKRRFAVSTGGSHEGSPASAHRQEPPGFISDTVRARAVAGLLKTFIDDHRGAIGGADLGKFYPTLSEADRDELKKAKTPKMGRGIQSFAAQHSDLIRVITQQAEGVPDANGTMRIESTTYPPGQSPAVLLPEEAPASAPERAPQAAASDNAASNGGTAAEGGKARQRAGSVVRGSNYLGSRLRKFVNVQGGSVGSAELLEKLVPTIKEPMDQHLISLVACLLGDSGLRLHSVPAPLRPPPGALVGGGSQCGAELAAAPAKVLESDAVPFTPEETTVEASVAAALPPIIDAASAATVALTPDAL
uniref:Uncharacterized protein n=1 Tax=Coccolithus braarudii TaxID=221442 RepID=A0A7S0L746_9EUKA|mmetsp:Transcript_2411/g.5025  ORF Transcript_2411/g.5025 Transcript_2411/m.5025 type:complete len:417 (+) Transcript_2411:64-1314(+)